MKNYLLIDVSTLAYRALHTTGDLSYGGSPTGVLFGVWRAIDSLTELHEPDICIFAFDSGGTGLRGEIEPTYKANRKKKELTEEEQELQATYYQQVTQLRREILPDLGYNNIHRVKGYEADDILAYYAERIPQRDQAVIVTSDNDLWQCLRKNVSWYSPTKKQMVTWESFREEWSIFPNQWVDVKAIAGCTADGVKGIKGIGEKNAVKWIRQQLPPESKKYEAIMDGLDIVSRNMQLVRLPFAGLKLPKPKKDERSQEKVNQVMSRLGFNLGRTTASRRAVMKGLF